jgi:DNA-binding NarL/FixJ family response regulator
MQVVCIDDNEWIGESIHRILRNRKPDINGVLSWGGWFQTSGDFLEKSDTAEPVVVVLDLDIPGEDAFESIATLTSRCPDARILILSGYLRADLVDRALNQGAWGYISKNEAAAAVLDAITRVAAGEIALSPAVVEEYQRQ